MRAKYICAAMGFLCLLFVSCATTKNPVNAYISETSATAGSTAVSPAKKSDIDSPTIPAQVAAHTFRDSKPILKLDNSGLL